MPRCTPTLKRTAGFLLIACGLVSAARAAPGVPEVRGLTNGLQYVILEDHTLPLVSVSLWVHSGSKDEIETSAGYAHFLEHLIQRGTDTAPAFEYQRMAHRWGGSLSVRANYDRTYITASGVADALEPMLGALSAMAFSARLEDKEIDQELGTLSQENHTYYDDPSSVAFLECMRAAFPKHPYRFPPLGNFKTIGTLKHDGLSAFYKNLYVPNNMTLAIAGDVDPARARALVEGTFGKVRASATLPPKTSPPAGFTGHDDKEKPLELKESWTTLSFVGPGYRNPDRAAFEVLARALGDSGGAPILKGLVAAKAGSTARVIYYRLEDAGLLFIGLSPSAPELSYPAATAAMQEIAAFKKRGLRPEEVQTHVQRILLEERQKAERLDGLAEALGEAALFGSVRYYWDLPDVYSRLTAADIGRVAAKYLVGENLRLVVIVPKAAAASGEEVKAKFHEALDTLGGVPPGSPPPALEKNLYSGEEETRWHAEAWGDPRDAAALRPAVTWSLANGLSVAVQEDHRRRLAAVSLQIRAGSGDDPAGKEGLAAIAGQLLSPTPTLPGRGDLFRLKDRVVVMPEIQVGRDLTEARFLTAPADLAAGLAALATAVQKPAAEDATLESIRKGATEFLTRAVDDPAYITLELFREKVYAGHPYAHPSAGTSSGLASLTRADVQQFQKGSWRPERSVLVVTGDVAAADVRKMVQDQFGRWEADPARPTPSGKRGKETPAHTAPATAGEHDGGAPAGSPPPGPDGSPPTVAQGAANAHAVAGEFTRQVGAQQSSILVGVPASPILGPDFDDLRVLAAGLTVRAFEDIVFRRRAAFSATAIPEALRDGGSIALSVIAQHGRRDEAVFDVQQLLRSLTLADADANDARDFSRVEAGREAAASQGVLALASALAYREAAGLGAASLQKSLSHAPAPSAARIKELAQHYLRPESWIVIKVGPPSP